MTAHVLVLVGVVLIDHLMLARAFDPTGTAMLAARMHWAAITALASAFVLAATLPFSQLVPGTAAPVRMAAALVQIGLVAVVTTVLVFALQRRYGHSPRFARVLAPLIVLNGCALGLVALHVSPQPDLGHASLLALALGTVFALALLLFTAMLARLDTDAIPAPLRGAPIACVQAALMALALAGYAALFRS